MSFKIVREGKTEAQKISELNEQNKVLDGKPPRDIIYWALSIAKKPIISTNFGPFSASLLHAVTNQSPKINVVWIDTGYNTSQTYKYALGLIKQLKLNINIYVPKESVAYRNITLGIPSFKDPKHAIFTEQVKLEPFRRAINILKPDIWFTNIRKGQTAFRDNLNVLSLSKNGILKVSPFYNYSDDDLKEYLKIHQLPNETRYYDPTKQISNRECGIHD